MLLLEIQHKKSNSMSQPSYNIFTFREEEFGKKFKCINGIINGKKRNIVVA